MRPVEKVREVRAELVTTAFVAAGVPAGVHDLGRFLEMLNNPAISQYIELQSPTVRPLYHATLHVDLDAPLLVKREDIIFATFDGPGHASGGAMEPKKHAPALLMAPPFQISGSVEVAPGADPTQALRAGMPPFFVVKFARVLDADGVALGDGEQIVVNAAAVQMRSATRRHIEAPVTTEAPGETQDAATEVTAAESATADMRAA